MQIFQPKLDEVLLKIVPDVYFGRDDGAYILGKARRLLGAEVNVSLQQVNSIPRIGRGKFRNVVSEVI